MNRPTHPSPHPLTARATGILWILVTVAAVIITLAVMAWVLVAAGARLALGLAG